MQSVPAEEAAPFGCTEGRRCYAGGPSSHKTWYCFHFNWVGEGEARGSEFRVYAGPTVRPALGFPRDEKGAGYAGRLSDPPEGGTPNRQYPAKPSTELEWWR
jgi:hypothetical protein